VIIRFCLQISLKIVVSPKVLLKIVLRSSANLGEGNYKSLVAVMICATLVNTQTDTHTTHTHRQTDK